MKIRNFVLVVSVGLFLCACQNNKNINTPKNQILQTKANIVSLDSEMRLMQKDEIFMRLNNNCDSKNIQNCMAAGNYLYAKSKFAFAAWYYDEICSKMQYIPACLKLAKMYEEGIGVPKNIAIAKDIYKSACYMGDKQSCEKMK